MHIISLSAEAIIGVLLSGLKAVSGDVAPLLAAEAVLGDEVLVSAAEAVSVEAVGEDDSRGQMTEDGGRKKHKKLASAKPAAPFFRFLHHFTKHSANFFAFQKQLPMFLS